MSFFGGVSTAFFAFVCFWFVILLFKRAPRHNTEVLAKSKKSKVCLVGIINVWDKLPSGVG